MLYVGAQSRERLLCIGRTEEGLSEEVRFKCSFNTTCCLGSRGKSISVAADVVSTMAYSGVLIEEVDNIFDLSLVGSIDL